MTSFQDMVEFNDKIIKNFSQQVLDDEHETLTIYSAMWPLSMGKEEAALFLNNTDSFATWLHEKKSMDIYYATPNFYVSKQGIKGRYFLFSDLPSVFPDKPAVPFGITDSKTGKPLTCDQWEVSLRRLGTTDSLCEMEYSKFLSIIPEDKKSKYDGAHFLLSAFTTEEINALSNQ